MQADGAVPVIELHRFQGSDGFNANGRLFCTLSDSGLGNGFARSHFAARKLPQSAKRIVGGPPPHQPSGSPPHDCQRDLCDSTVCHDFTRFRRKLLSQNLLQNKLFAGPPSADRPYEGNLMPGQGL